MWLVLPFAPLHRVGALDVQLFTARCSARVLPWHRFADPPSRAHAHELGAIVDGYSFDVQNLHLQPPAGLPGAQGRLDPGFSPSAKSPQHNFLSSTLAIQAQLEQWA